MKEFSKNVFEKGSALRDGEDSYELPVLATYVRCAHVDVDYITAVQNLNR